MKIIQETQVQLSLKQGNSGSIIFGIIFIIVGIGAAIVASQNKMMAMLIGGFFVLGGILAVVTAKSITIIIDKAQNKITLLTAGITGKKTEDIALNQIKEVSLEEYMVSNTSRSGPRNQLKYNLVFYLADGQGFPIPITSSSGSFFIGGIPVGGIMSMMGRNKNIALGNKIAAFIGVPFVDRRSPTVSEVVKGVVQNLKSEKPLNEVPQVQNASVVQNIPVSQPSSATPQNTQSNPTSQNTSSMV